MKRYINQIKEVCCILLGVIALSSCKENIFQTEELKTGIYFSTDSLKYSFGVTPLDITERDVNVPVRIMGHPAKVDREFSIELTNVGEAISGVHYSIPDKLLLSADSVNTVLPIKILRDNLGTDEFRLAFKLVENEHFVPVNATLKDAVVYFNNNVDRPNWRSGDQLTWFNTRLGPAKPGLGWNPVVYIKFIELFRQMEYLAPDRYGEMVLRYGPDLATLTAWPFDYEQSLRSFVLIPLYKYYMEENTELGETIPRPSGY